LESITVENFRFRVSERVGEVSAAMLVPQKARALFVMAHGAGAGMRHPFMEALARSFAASRIATLRYQFPYMEKGSKRPDSPAVLTSTVRAAIAAASEHNSGLPLFAAGKSMGGRMTSLAEASEPLPNVAGLVFFGFPLHAAGKPSSERGAHLFEVAKPMLFLQGSRDGLADLQLLKPLCDKLGRRAELFVVEGGDHSFHMLKRSGRSDGQMIEVLAQTVASWAGRMTGQASDRADSFAQEF
jgi:predicted alpha/beta-hydrolase family hydrolase